VFHSSLHEAFRRGAPGNAGARYTRIGLAEAPVFQSSGQVSLEKESCGGYAIPPAVALAFALALAGQVELA